MNKYILDKALKLEEGVDKIEDISLDDELNYTNLSEGLRVEGRLIVKGKCIKGEECKEIDESIDVDILFPSVRESELASTRLFISDFSYSLMEDTLMMKIIYELQSDDCKEHFTLENQIKGVIKDLENEPNPFIAKIRSSLSKEDAEMLEKAMQGDFSNLEIISGEKEEDTIHPYIDLSEEEEIIIPENEEIIIEEDFLPFRNEEPLEKEEVIEKVEVKEEVKDNKLFKEESYVIVASFYKCKKGDTYASIAEANLIDINDLIVLNNNKEIVEGCLLLIKK